MSEQPVMPTGLHEVADAVARSRGTPAQAEKLALFLQVMLLQCAWPVQNGLYRMACTDRLQGNAHSSAKTCRATVLKSLR